MAKLQVFLDNHHFRPGIIDGKWGEFTRKALDAYCGAQGVAVSSTAGKPPDDLAFLGDEPVFSSYTVTEADVKCVGELADSPEEKARIRIERYWHVDSPRDASRSA